MPVTGCDFAETEKLPHRPSEPGQSLVMGLCDVCFFAAMKPSL